MRKPTRSGREPGGPRVTGGAPDVFKAQTPRRRTGRQGESALAHTMPPTMNLPIAESNSKVTPVLKESASCWPAAAPEAPSGLVGSITAASFTSTTASPPSFYLASAAAPAPAPVAPASHRAHPGAAGRASYRFLLGSTRRTTTQVSGRSLLVTSRHSVRVHTLSNLSHRFRQGPR